jgi:hypothetical protein
VLGPASGRSGQTGKTTQSVSIRSLVPLKIVSSNGAKPQALEVV